MRCRFLLICCRLPQELEWYMRVLWSVLMAFQHSSSKTIFLPRLFQIPKLFYYGQWIHISSKKWLKNLKSSKIESRELGTGRYRSCDKTNLENADQETGANPKNSWKEAVPSLFLFWFSSHQKLSKELSLVTGSYHLHSYRLDIYHSQIWLKQTSMWRWVSQCRRKNTLVHLIETASLDSSTSSPDLEAPKFATGFLFSNTSSKYAGKFYSTI